MNWMHESGFSRYACTITNISFMILCVRVREFSTPVYVCILERIRLAGSQLRKTLEN